MPPQGHAENEGSEARLMEVEGSKEQTRTGTHRWFIFMFASGREAKP